MVSSVSSHALREQVLVTVCPTEYGGQIEHAAELAAAALRTGRFARSIIISRPGAADNVIEWSGQFEMAEIFLPRRTAGGHIRRALQVLDSLRERSRLWRAIRALSRNHEVTVLWETGKYGLVARRSARHVAFVHNAVPHTAGRMSLRDRFMVRQERRVAVQSDSVALHGLEQQSVVAQWCTQDIIVVPLPGDSRTVQDAPTSTGALCIGEVRPNKGLELAIEAAAIATVPLTIVGLPDPPSYGAELAAVPRHSGTTLEFRYLEGSDFNSRLSSAQVVLLPYTHFAAQSGVLAKAMQYGRPIIAADLPSLREQAQGYLDIAFVAVGDASAFAEALGSALLREKPVSTSETASVARDEWNTVVDRIFA